VYINQSGARNIVQTPNSKRTCCLSYVQQSAGPPLESKLTAGQYTVVYGARDSSGNEARECSFDVVVRGTVYFVKSNISNLFGYVNIRAPNVA